MIDLLKEKTVPLKEDKCLCEAKIDITSHTDIVYLLWDDENGTRHLSHFDTVDEAVAAVCDLRLKQYITNIVITEVLSIDKFTLTRKEEE